MPGPLRAYRDGSLGQDGGTGKVVATVALVGLFIGVPMLLEIAGGGARKRRR